MIQLYNSKADDFQAKLSLFVFLSITMSNIIAIKIKKLIKQVSVLFMFALFTALTALTIAIKTDQTTIQALIGISLVIKIMIYYCIAKDDIQSSIKTHQKEKKNWTGTYSQ